MNTMLLFVIASTVMEIGFNSKAVSQWFRTIWGGLMAIGFVMWCFGVIPS